MTTANRHARLWLGGVLGLAVAFFVLYSAFMLVQYGRFHVHAFDFAIFDQGLWLLSRFQEPFVTVRGLHLFADHSSYVMLLLVPLYWVVPAQQVLIVFTVAVLAAGAPLGYALARARGASAPVAAAIGAGYLLHPAVAWAARDGFHPEYLVIPLAIGCLLLVERGRDGWAIALAALAVLAKEDVALLLVPLGLYVALARGRRRTGLVIAALAAAGMIVSFMVLLPHFSPTGAILYSDRYDLFGEGLVGIAVGLVTKPHLVVSHLLEPRSIGYAAALLLPIPIAALAPRVLLIGVPTLLANVLSDHVYQSSIEYHYTTYLIATVVIAAAAAGPRVSRWRGRWTTVAVCASLLVGVVAQIWLAPNPLSAPEQWPGDSRDHAVIREALDRVPDDAVVSAFNSFVPHLTHRTTVYQFPNPWQRLNYGPQGAELPDPGNVQWVVMRTDVFPEMQELVETLRRSGAFTVEFEEPPVIVLRRRP